MKYHIIPGGYTMKTSLSLVSTILLSCFCANELYAARLEWEIPLNERLEMVRTASVDYYINKKHQKKYDERNIINLTCYRRDDSTSGVKGDFTVFAKAYEEPVFKQIEKHFADFSIARNGRFSVDKKDFMPNLRHLPTFPEKDMPAGTEWSSPAEIVFNSFSVPFLITFNVRYAMKDIREMDGRSVAVVNYSFTMDRRFNERGLPEDMPVRVLGMNKGRMYWDIAGKKPHSMDDEYRVAFLYRTGAQEFATAEFAMKIKTRYKLYRQVAPGEKAAAVQELQKELPKDSGISVDEDARGIVLRLGEVLFDFDSYGLKNEAAGTLDRVSEIIREKYGDREVIVEGHTDNRGNAGYNQTLSEQRAHSVARYLERRGVRDKLSYRGYGEDKPIADNSSADGRRKNRRVEVIINLK